MLKLLILIFLRLDAMPDAFSTFTARRPSASSANWLPEGATLTGARRPPTTKLR